MSSSQQKSRQLNKRRYIAIVKYDPPPGIDSYSGYQPYAFDSPHEVPLDFSVIVDFHRESIHNIYSTVDIDREEVGPLNVTKALNVALKWIETYNLGSSEADQLLYIMNLSEHLNKSQRDRIMRYARQISDEIDPDEFKDVAVEKLREKTNTIYHNDTSDIEGTAEGDEYFS